MTIDRAPVAGLLLVGGIAVAAAAFGLANWRWLDQREALESVGRPAVARVEAVVRSHKACSSSLTASWPASDGVRHRATFMTCAADRQAGDPIRIRYLGDAPAVAMIENGEGGLPDSQFRRGALIGAIVSAVMAAVTIGLASKRR